MIETTHTKKKCTVYVIERIALQRSWFAKHLLDLFTCCMLCSVWGQAICGGGPFTGCTAVPRLPSISAESAPGSDAGPVGCHWGSWEERLGQAAKGSSEDLGRAERRGCQVVSAGWGNDYHGIKGQGPNCLHRERWATVSLIPWFQITVLCTVTMRYFALCCVVRLQPL